MIIFNTWNNIPDFYNQLKKLALSVLSLFESFSSENIIKSKLTSRIIDENLESCLKFKLKTTTNKPNLLKLSKEMQAHCITFAYTYCIVKYLLSMKIIFLMQ